MSKPKSGGSSLSIDKGNYPMTIVGVWDIGTQPKKVYSADGQETDEEKEGPQLVIECEIPEYKDGKKVVKSTKDEPAKISIWVNNTMGSEKNPSKPRKLARAVGLDPEDIDWDDFLGKSFNGQVDHSGTGKAKVASFQGLVKGQKVPKPFTELRSCYLDETFDPVAFEEMPKFVQDKAITSKEYEAVEAAQKNKKGKRGK